MAYTVFLSHSSDDIELIEKVEKIERSLKPEEIEHDDEPKKAQCRLV